MSPDRGFIRMACSPPGFRASMKELSISERANSPMSADTMSMPDTR